MTLFYQVGFFVLCGIVAILAIKLSFVSDELKSVMSMMDSVESFMESQIKINDSTNNIESSIIKMLDEKIR